ncbi:MAG: NAD(P)-dependent oxidoreductase [Chitinophagales bacterium]|nr:NAD(P)-dependent oxidoreductase [Chitinophagales bacterium]
MKIGIIKESKTPPDTRVPLTPKQCKSIVDNYPTVEIKIQESESRCYTDNEYKNVGLQVVSDVSDCDILMGVKEVKIPNLIADKHYFFFSHTIKKQAYNRDLLRTILEKHIQLSDYETLTDEDGKRVIAFGRWAGIVGAHNGIKTWGKRLGLFDLKAMYKCFDFNEAKTYYNSLNLHGLKIVLTGTGRVSHGSAEVLDLMNIKKLEAEDFLQFQGNEAVYCMLATEQLFAKDADNSFDNDFYKNPTNYHSILKPYLSKANVLINGIYWDNKAPALFTKENMKESSFSIEVIADITCDIAPVSSIPSTLNATTIAEPVFGYNPLTEQEEAPYQNHVIDMMTVDNLPNELPRDASKDFGNQFIEHVLPELIKDKSNMIYKASITTKVGELNEPYLYLEDYVNS